MTSHPSEWLQSLSQQRTSTGEGRRRRERLCTVGGNADWFLCIRMRIVWTFLKKLKGGIAVPYSNSKRPKKRSITKETQNTDLKEYMQPCVHCSVIYNSQALEVTLASIDRRADKRAVVHLHNGVLLGHQKERDLTICNMDGPRRYYSKCNKSGRERKYCMTSSYVESN